MEKFKRDAINQDVEEKENSYKYGIAFEDFLAKNKFIETQYSGNDERVKKSYTIESENIAEYNEREKKRKLTEILTLQGVEFLKNFFESGGFKNIPPKSIINENSITLFTSAGVQNLDLIIHNEEEIKERKIYVAQPVVRTQFIPIIKEEILSSFINISTEIVNATPEEHFHAFDYWIKFLETIGLEKDRIILRLVDSKDKWGERKFLSKVIKLDYNDLEIGDAMYIADMPQNTRNNLSISDMGFGLERIKLARTPSEPFFENIASIPDIDYKTIDCLRTLVLLAGSGVEPANNKHGYRFRQLSKLLTRINFGKEINRIDFNNLIEFFYDNWKNWTNFITGKENIIKIINIENERNFNRELLNILKEKYRDVDININQSTEKLIKALKHTSVDQNYLKNLLKKIL